MAIKALLSHDGAAITSVEQWTKKREDIKARLYSVIGAPPVPRNTRDVETLDEQTQPGCILRTICYTVGAGDRVTAYLLIPRNVHQPLPAVVAMHQTVNSGKDEVAGLDGQRDFAYGRELVELGYVVLAPDYLTAGERIYPGQEGFDSGPFYQQYPGWSMVGKNVEDSLAAVDVLCGLDFVARERIGVIGHSHGGHNAIFAAALDERVKVCVSNCGMSVFTEEEERLEWSLKKGYIYIPALREYFLQDREPPFDLHEVAALIAPRAWLNISAYFDVAYGNQEFLAETGVLLYQVYQLYGQPSAFAYFMHGNDHSFPQHARQLAYEWLDRYLL